MIRLLGREELGSRALGNADVRIYEAALLSEAGRLRSRAVALDSQLEGALADLRQGGDLYLAEAISLAISLGGIITFQWIAVVGGLSALYASVRSRWTNNRDPIRRIVSVTGEMRRLRVETKRLRLALADVTAEKRRRQADPSVGWP